MLTELCSIQNITVKISLLRPAIWNYDPKLENILSKKIDKNFKRTVKDDEHTWRLKEKNIWLNKATFATALNSGNRCQYFTLLTTFIISLLHRLCSGSLFGGNNLSLITAKTGGNHEVHVQIYLRTSNNRNGDVQKTNTLVFSIFVSLN